MICPNCKETDHEPGARFCIVCGHPLPIEDNDGADNGRRNRQPEEVYPKESVKIHSEGRQRGVPAWYYRGFGGHDDNDADDAPQGLKWKKALKWILMTLIFVEYIVISIHEAPMYQPWGGVAIGLVNVPVFILTLFLCSDPYLDDKKGFWNMYYHWLHFILAALVPLVGYLIFTNIQNLLTIILEGGLSFFMTAADCGTFESIFSDD